MSACMECHFCGVLSGLALDEEAVFSLADEVGNAIHLKNVVETVDVAGGLYAFRNAPHFVPFGLAGAEDLDDAGALSVANRAAVAETEALIDHMFEHSNTPPFFARHLIQRTVTSNPSPRYVAAVADAFRSGAYDGRTYSGAYGDIGAAVAAALSDREARSATILADPTHGRLREPLLKVLHFARAMELSPTGGREVSLEGMDQKIGQMAHEAPSVFSYYLPDYSPQGAVGDRGLVAPEAQVLTGTQMIGLLNGLHSLIDHGLSRCASGFGGETGSCQWPAAGGLAFAPADDAAAAAVAELDVLLTEGRLSAGSRAVVEAAYGAATDPAAALRAAQERMVLAPEFHATNVHEPGAPRDSSKYEKPSSAKFKAAVMLFLNGAVDSYTMLVPHSQCEHSNRLAREYREYRGPVADAPFDVTDDYLLIEPREDTQPCGTFGMHPSLANVHGLYEDGDAAWFANVGPLVEPITVDEYRSGAKRTPPSIGAHNVQQRIAQSVHSDDMNAQGVMGRILDALSNPKANPLNAVGYSLNGMQKALEGSGAADVVDLNGGNGNFPRLLDYDRLRADFEALTDPESSSAFADTFAGLVGSAVLSAEEISAVFEGNDGLTATFPNTGLGNRFRNAARVVRSREALEHERAAFFLEIGGFDTHGNLDSLPGKLTEIDDAVAAFADEMKAQGIFEDVAIVTMSDFGRTLTWNGAGTDHGWAGHHFIVGGGLNGSQILGHYPETMGPNGAMNIDEGRGRLIPTTPWESMWEPLAKFMGVKDEDMDYVIPNRHNFPDLLVESDVFETGPTSMPTPAPSAPPSSSPYPTPEPSADPTEAPSPAPTPLPSISPVPSAAPSPEPSMTPTVSKVPTTAAPSVSPVPTAAPSISAAPTLAPVCGGVPGVTSYGPYDLHCLALGDGQIVDVLAVEGGARTCRHTDANSCPEGFDIWVPRSYEHAEAVYEALGAPLTGLVGVYKESNGCAGCTRVPMNSAAYDAWVAEDLMGRVSAIDASVGGCLYAFNLYDADGSANQFGDPEGVAFDGLEFVNTTSEYVSRVRHYGGCDESLGRGVTFTISNFLEGDRKVKDVTYGATNAPLVGDFEAAWPCQITGVDIDGADVSGADIYCGGARDSWTSVAGDEWFLRSETYTEPNGNYLANCWLTTNWRNGWEAGVGFRLDDNQCNLCFDDYLCSTNRVDYDGPTSAPSAFPSGHPTISPLPTHPPTTSIPSHAPAPLPTAVPTISSPPSIAPTPAPSVVGVCGGEAGEFEYGDHALHCLEVDGEVHNVIPITGGARRRRATGVFFRVSFA